MINFRYALFLLLFFGMACPWGIVFAQDYGQSDQQSTTAIAKSESVSVTEQQVREALVKLLQQSGETDGGTSQVSADRMIYSGGAIDNWAQSRSNALRDRVHLLWNKLPEFGSEVWQIWLRVAEQEPLWGSVYVIVVLVIIIGMAVTAQHYTIHRLLERLYGYIGEVTGALSQKIKFVSLRIIIELIGLGIYALVAFGCAAFATEENSMMQLFVFFILTAVMTFKLWRILLRAIFSPKHSSIRPIPMDNDSAVKTYLWFSMFFAIFAFGPGATTFLNQAGMSEILTSGLLIPISFLLNFLFLVRIWFDRKGITQAFVGGESEQEESGFVRDFFIHSWPFLFTCWLVLVWMLWLYKAFMGQWDDAEKVEVSWWITLAFPIFDRLVHGLLNKVARISWLQCSRFEARSARFVNIVQTGIRLILVGVAVYTVTDAWGLNTSNLVSESISQQVLKQGVNILIIATVAYVLWELCHAMIESKLPDEDGGGLASLEGDAGGAGASRAETLMPLLRSFLTVVLVTFVILTVLHSLGVAITPLLAGAGVVGIAIGFGAQKLVQDVLSGIFFLVDDAFRRGEYIELEGLKGTVEKISLRSMQLRHHLGAVQTIPYGEIKTVKNLSRDWVTMKLELRLAYDADIEKVRKTIKKVGQQMMQDEELASSFLLPLKSQGVMRVEESALIVRMKFTTKPGEQWVVRREAYRRVRDALAEAGIFFAHREVRVRLPEDFDRQTAETTEKIKAKELLPQVAAAAATGVIAQEALKQDKLDTNDDEM